MSITNGRGHFWWHDYQKGCQKPSKALDMFYENLNTFLLKKKTNKLRLQWIIDSAATGSHTSGSSIYPSAQKELKNHGINYKHTARQVTKQIIFTVYVLSIS